MKRLKHLSHKFWLWLGIKIEQHRTNGVGFEAIYYKGKPIDIQESAPDGVLFMYEPEDVIVKGYES